MEMFEPVERGFDEGGLMDEGGTVDPVSGNNVPPGSTQEEVRDDIPAQLSEGEFVFPADVVRYIGLENLMRMRQEAKQGLAQMDAMGQMGNSEEATMPDNLPFDMYDLDIEEDNKYNSDSLQMNVGGYIPFQPNQGQSSGYVPYVNPTPFVPQTTMPYTGTQFTSPTQNTNIPTFSTFMGSGYQGSDLRAYINDAGQVQYIPFVDGKPLYPIPAGFRPKGDDPQAETSDTTGTTTQTQTDTGDGGDGGDGGGIDPSTSTGVDTAKVGSISELLNNFKGLIGGGDPDAPRGKSVGDIFVSAADKNNYFGGSKDFGFGNEALRKATAQQAISQLGTLGLTGIVTELTKAAGLTNFTVKDIGVAGFTGMNQALNSMGLTNRGQLMNDRQATLVGQAMSAAHTAAFRGQDTQAAINKVLGTQEAIDIQDRAYDAIKNAYVEKAGAKGTFTDRDFANEMARVERSAVADLERGFNRQTSRDSKPGQAADAEFRSNVVTDRNGNPVTSKRTGKNVLTAAGKDRKDKLNAIANQARINKQQARKRAEEAKAAEAERDRYRSEFTASQDDGGYDPGAGFTGGVGLSEGQVSESVFSDEGNGQGDNESSSSSSSSSSSDAGGASGLSGSYGGYDDFMNKGGLATQMKRSGLASKK